jgi:hypothetical protein
MFQFNADGSCRFYQQAFKGRYERVTENGRDMLKILRDRMQGDEQEPLPDIYQVTSIKKDELVFTNHSCRGTIIILVF